MIISEISTIYMFIHSTTFGNMHIITQNVQVVFVVVMPEWFINNRMHICDEFVNQRINWSKSMDI